MNSSLNYFSFDMSLSNPDIQNHMIIDQDESEYEENKENFFNNQYSNQQQPSSTSLRSSPVNNRHSNNNRNNNINGLNERAPLQDLSELEGFTQLSINTTYNFIAQQENQFIQYRKQQKKCLSPSQNNSNNKNAQQTPKVTRANLLR